MSIKKSQAILKCVIDLKYSDWFSLGSEDETNCFVTLRTIPADLNYHMSIKKSQAILKCFIDFKYSVWFTLD